MNGFASFAGQTKKSPLQEGGNSTIAIIIRLHSLRAEEVLVLLA